MTLKCQNKWEVNGGVLANLDTQLVFHDFA